MTRKTLLAACSWMVLWGSGCVVDFKLPMKDGELDAPEEEDATDGQETDPPADEADMAACGNGRVETALGEECDDGANGNDEDGCTDGCLFSCHDDGECTDGDICNGEETCNLTGHVCEDGTAMEDGSVCVSDPRSICLGGVCRASVCGDGFVDHGLGESCEPPGAGVCGPECRTLCDDDSDCEDDGDACNGEEYCETEVGMCSQRNPLSEGTSCGTDPRRICIGWTCQESLCGDGFIDVEGGEACEDGNTLEGDGCDNDCTFSCRSDPECADAYACSNDHCDLGTHTCSNPVKPAGEVCRIMSGPCDLAELCDGASPDCPADAFVASDVVCRNAAGLCDVPEHCPGDGGACPPDALEPLSDVCRASTSACDPAETCDGETPTCPPDVYLCACLDDTDCPDDGNPCNGEEYCDTTASQCARRNVPVEGEACGTSPRRICVAETCMESICGDGFADVGTGEECDDGNGVDGDGCETDCTYSCRVDGDCTDSHDCTDDRCEPTFHRCENLLTMAGSVCRTSAGACDTAEMCTGLDPDCPGNAFAPSTVTCRASTGACDPEERCTGSSAACPTDALSPPTTICRAAPGSCDIEESCTGTGSACPADAFYSSTTVCRAAAGSCDVAERCTGSSATCPSNQFLPPSTVCRPSTLGCDPAEQCTGSSSQCPVDVSNCTCTGDGDCPDDGNPCNGQEYCNTGVGDCDHRSVPSDGAECGTTPRRICLEGSCQVSRCGDGWVDAVSGEECDDGNGVNGDGCDGTCTYSCHGDGECADSYLCTTDRCDPAQRRCQNTLRSSGTVCRSAAGECDVAEVCNGTSPSCPDDVFLPSTTECRAASGACDLPEMCTGTSATCPPDGGKVYAYHTPPGADASSRSSSHWPHDAIDGSLGSYWLSGYSSPPEWIWFDLGGPQCIGGVKAAFTGSYVPITMDIQVSDTLSSWTTVVPGYTVTVGGAWIVIPFDPPVSGRYIRLYETGFASRGNCAELQALTADP